MVHEVSCLTRLSLCLGDHDFPRNHLLQLIDQEQEHYQEQLQKESLIEFDQSPLSLKLGLGGDQECRQDPINVIRQASNLIIGAVSSFSNTTNAKRESDGGSEEVENMSSKVIVYIDRDDSQGVARKKLKMTKEQSFVLEENFKQQNILNPKQKQTLALSLDLRPRQVEVWFQNRRARTKLKQSERDCTLLKKCCEVLKSDNIRLKKEIKELKAVRSTTISPQFYKKFPAATHSMCPSCERIVSGNSSGDGGGDTAKSSKTPFSRASKLHSQLFSRLC